MADPEIIQAIEESRRAFVDLRTFLRELTLRQERVFATMIERLEAQTVGIRALTLAVEDHRREFQEHRREFREEYEAHREALFRMLERLDGGGAEPAGA